MTPLLEIEAKQLTENEAEDKRQRNHREALRLIIGCEYFARIRPVVYAQEKEKRRARHEGMRLGSIDFASTTTYRTTPTLPHRKPVAIRIPKAFGNHAI